MPKKILFIDRDGTIIKEPKDDFQVDSLQKLSFEENAINALLALKSFGFSFVMVTNQDGLGTKSFPKADFDIAHNKMLEILASCGIVFDDIFICPHFSEDKCECRKPKTKLLQAYIENNLYDKEQSFVIGDRSTDMELAKNLQIQGLLYGKDFSWLEIKDYILANFRKATVSRKTKETQISATVTLNLSKSHIDTGIGFFNHMLEQIATHANIGINISCIGDLHIDEHHTVEDCAIVLGEAIKKAIGDKIGLARYGFCLPMDESLGTCVIDFSNRPFLSYKAKFKKKKLGKLSTEMIEHFFYSLAHSMGVSLHLKVKGKNDHHKAEALFKAFARALKMTLTLQEAKLASSKGVL